MMNSIHSASPSDLKPVSRAASAQAYRTHLPDHPIQWWLDANTGPILPELADLFRDVSLQSVGRYPDASALEQRLADEFQLCKSSAPRDVVVTAGADDAIDRLCRAYLEPGRAAVLTKPTFPMIRRGVLLYGAQLGEIDWLDGPFPTQRVIQAAISSRASVVFVVSPNNPTGGVISPADLELIAASLSNSLIVLDLAYTEFADVDLMSLGVKHDNMVVTRTFSKAWCAAGLRVGCAVGASSVIERLRAVGQPFSVSGVSIEVMQRWLDAGRQIARHYVAQARIERTRLVETLCKAGAVADPSQGNFVFARFTDAKAVCSALALRGVAVRSFKSEPIHDSAGVSRDFQDYLRITCPGSPIGSSHLFQALSEILRTK